MPITRPAITPPRDLELRIAGLLLQASLGIHPHERVTRQPVVLDIAWSMARRCFLAGDAIESTIDYDGIVRVVEALVAGQHFNLLEVLMLAIEKELLAAFPLRNLRVSVCKPGAIPAAQGVLASNGENRSGQDATALLRRAGIDA